MTNQVSPDGSELNSTDSDPITSPPLEPVNSRATGSTPGWVWVAGGCGCVAVICLIMIPLLIALLLPAVQTAREASRRMESLNNLKEIGLANFTFESTHNRLAASYNTDKNGRPLLSWRVHMLPYMEYGNLYDRFRLDEPWDSPHNQALIPLMPDVYRSPFSLAPEGQTTYLGNAVEGELSPSRLGRTRCPTCCWTGTGPPTFQMDLHRPGTWWRWMTSTPSLGPNRPTSIHPPVPTSPPG